MDISGNRLLRIMGRSLLLEVLILSAVATDSPTRLRFPDEDMGKDSLPSRKKAQVEAARQFRVFHQFQFEDGKSGYLAQSVFAAPLRSGRRVEVDWPSGRKQLVESSLEENQTLVITEPK